MATPRFASIKDYLDTLPPDQKKTAAKILRVIKTQFPESEAKIAWNVPQVQIYGKYVFGMMAFKNHINLNAWSGEVIKKFEKRLGDYSPDKYTFKVPNNWVVDEKLIVDIVKTKIKEL